MEKSRKLFFSLMVVLLALLAAAPLASYSPATATPISALISDHPADVFAVGDTWTWNNPVNTTYNLTITDTVVGIVSVEDWNGTIVQCHNFSREQYPLDPNLNVSWHSSYLRTSDGAEIAYEGISIYNKSGDYIEMYTFTYVNVPKYPEFPYSVGKTWNQTYTGNVTGHLYFWNSTSGWINETRTRLNASQATIWEAGEVLNVSTVTVPAGTFETWCINSTNISTLEPYYAYYSPTVKNWVLVTNSTGDTMLELISYSVSYPTTDALRAMIFMMLFGQILSPPLPMAYILLGVGSAAVVVCAAAGIFLWRRRV